MENTHGSHYLHPLTYAIHNDRRVYDRWYNYDALGCCSPNLYINPDLAIVSGMNPTLYGEVKSYKRRGNASNDKPIAKLSQAVCRILNYTDRCFAIYAKPQELKIIFYQRDENIGKVYMEIKTFSHSLTIAGTNLVRKSLAEAVRGRAPLAAPQGQVSIQPPLQPQQLVGGFDMIIKDLVKIVMLNEANANTVYQGSLQSDQFAAQCCKHNRHLLSKTSTIQGAAPRRPDPTAPANAPRDLGYVEQWTWPKLMYKCISAFQDSIWLVRRNKRSSHDLI